MPGLRGKDKKQFFNRASIGLPVALACGGAMVGLDAGGMLGAIIGAGLGLVGGGRIAEKGRFYRR